MKFKKIRKIVSKTDAISIMLSSIGDVDKNYINIDAVPDKYDKMKVIGFGRVSGITVENKHFDGILLNGVEFLLNDEKKDHHKLKGKDCDENEKD